MGILLANGNTLVFKDKSDNRTDLTLYLIYQYRTDLLNTKLDRFCLKLNGFSPGLLTNYGVRRNLIWNKHI